MNFLSIRYFLYVLLNDQIYFELNIVILETLTGCKFCKKYSIFLLSYIWYPIRRWHVSISRKNNPGLLPENEIGKTDGDYGTYPLLVRVRYSYILVHANSDASFVWLSWFMQIRTFCQSVLTLFAYPILFSFTRGHMTHSNARFLFRAEKYSPKILWNKKKKKKNKKRKKEEKMCVSWSNIKKEGEIVMLWSKRETVCIYEILGQPLSTLGKSTLRVVWIFLNKYLFEIIILALFRLTYVMYV